VQDTADSGPAAETRESASMLQRASVHSGAAHAGNVHGALMHGASSHTGHAEPSARAGSSADRVIPPAASTAVAPAAAPVKSPADALDANGLPMLPPRAEPGDRGADAARANGTSTDAAPEAAREHSASPGEPPSLSQLRTQARVALGAQDWKAAATAASLWLAREGGVEPAIALARALSALGRREEARTVMIACCKRHPNSEEAARMARQLGIPQSTEPAHAKSKHTGSRAPH
jgi:hypothetical protein